MKITLSVKALTALLFIVATVNLSGCTQSSGSSHNGNYDFRLTKNSEKIVSYDNGGNVIQYALKVKKLSQSRRKIRFSGQCNSACTIYLSLPRHQTCISPGASFGFHMPHGGSNTDNRTAAHYMINAYPYWVRNWIFNHGGLNSNLKIMGYKYARQYLRSCNTRYVKLRQTKRNI